MMKSSALLAGALALAWAFMPNTADAQGRRGGDDHWELLGCERVGNRPDYDVIRVGRREGRFKAIRLEARGNSISVLDLKVVYANGAPDSIPVRSEINEGDRSRPLDLRGRERSIDSIELVTRKDFRGPGRGRAEVCVFGLQDDDRGDRRWDDRGDRRGDDRGGDRDRDRDRDRGDRRGDWVELGCRNVGFIADRDVIPVGRREGRFKAIKLNVAGNDVHILDLKVIYANGAPDDISVRSRIREGGETRPLDLRGFDRSIDRVELVYERQVNFRGRAKVCVHGLQ
jgi:hypothetical protein